MVFTEVIDERLKVGLEVGEAVGILSLKNLEFLFSRFH